MSFFKETKLFPYAFNSKNHANNEAGRAESAGIPNSNDKKESTPVFTGFNRLPTIIVNFQVQPGVLLIQNFFSSSDVFYTIEFRTGKNTSCAKA
jgi:hypothetical protein